MTTASFITVLVPAANDPTETPRRLQRIAATIRAYQGQIACLESAANDPGESVIIFEPSIIATSIACSRRRRYRPFSEGNGGHKSEQGALRRKADDIVGALGTVAALHSR